MHTIRLSMRYAWWLRYYLYGLVTMAVLTRRQPDWDKVGRVMVKAVRIKAEPVAVGIKA